MKRSNVAFNCLYNKLLVLLGLAMIKTSFTFTVNGVKVFVVLLPISLARSFMCLVSN